MTVPTSTAPLNASEQQQELAALARHLASRRDAVLRAWRKLVDADPKLTTGASLPLAQLNDHMPALLQDYEARLRSDPLRVSTLGDAAAHGLHRWQQGFDLEEVTRELGRLNECLVEELERYALNAPLPMPATMARARLLWAGIYNVAIGASTSQYFKLQQIEASSHIRELEGALESLRHLERARAELWQQAAHDLRGNLGVVANATAVLESPKADDAARARFSRLLVRNVHTLHRLLDDVTSLARLQSGQEHRQLAPVDVAALMHELGDAMRSQADDRGLTLEVTGAAPFTVTTDAVKLRRVVQNLVLNAIRYTLVGGLDVSWGNSAVDDPDRWMLRVKDSGPGLHKVPPSELVDALGAATENSRSVAAQASRGEIGHMHDGLAGLSPDGPRPYATELPPGEGIGLSIVKRLCDLLHATVHVDSTPLGTTFCILLPRAYP